MARKTTFISEGKWYKGNTHTHTNLSDGKLDPESVSRIYRENGYSFLVLTDHCRYGIHEDLCTDGFIILPGVELDNVGSNAVPGGKTFCHHIVGIGLPGRNKYEHGHIFNYDKYKTDVNDIVKMLTDNGNIAIYAHPNWSHVRQEDIDTIEGCLGMEIYNNTCEVSAFTGYSDSYYDRQLWDRRSYYCFASDDSHQHKTDYLGGYIVVKAARLTQQAVTEAIIAGSFYASNGPEIRDFYVEDGKAVVECSDCASIGFLADSIFGEAVTSEEGLITKGEYSIKGTESYIRAVCRDDKGRSAWCQPIWLT